MSRRFLMKQVEIQRSVTCACARAIPSWKRFGFKSVPSKILVPKMDALRSRCALKARAWFADSNGI